VKTPFFIKRFFPQMMNVQQHSGTVCTGYAGTG